jgi:Fe2+ or Zn2+ uptake regulation protein
VESEIDADVIDVNAMDEAIRARSGFRIDPPHLTLTGLCAACAAQPG